MRFLVPLAVLTVLIKKNPFYRSYPIMLPIMICAWFFTLYRAVAYSKRTNRMVHQILLDQTGSELTFVYKNQTTRRIFGHQTEETHMVQGMHNPPQFGYKPLSGDLMPDTYPFNYASQHDYGYFWLKYFISQTSFFAIPKKPIYANYEALINAMNMNVIDFSHADIHELKSDQMTDLELSSLLELHNEYNFDRFSLRKYQIDNLNDLEQKLLQRQNKVVEEHTQVQKQVQKSFDELMDLEKPTLRATADGASSKLKAGV